MAVARQNHTATLPADGRVLVASGACCPDAELFDPATGTWAPTGPMVDNRAGHTATRLPDGRVLVAGGNDASPTGVTATAELFTSATGTWAATGSMASSRFGHVAALLADGRVLVAGGLTRDALGNVTPLASAELFSPATGTWAATGSLTTTRYQATAALLADGRVLVAGGTGSANFTAQASAELFDPATGIWTPTGSMAATRSGHTATVLTSGLVLAAGGDPTGTGAELFTPGATPTASATLSTLSLSPTSVPAGKPSQGTVTLSAPAPAGGASVSLSSSNPAVASVPASVTVPAGATSATFTVTTGQVSTTTTVTISASLGGVTKTAALSVVPADTVAITLAEYDVAKQVLNLQATSTSTTVTLTASVTSTGQVIGTLTNVGGGQYQGQFAWPTNSQNITVTSTGGGSASSAVTPK